MGRRRKYNNSTVISIRISDVEMDDITRIMATSRIERVSDLMREAILLFKSNLPVELQRVLERSKRPAYGKLS
ncbi:MAG TPA: hypothetical protein VFF53_06590 [Geobacteraceae bacterium]|nr:hypothetical protein [Geobacteraceae bacterium]